MSNDAHSEKLRVLIVDNNADHADSLSMLVKHWGHDTLVAYGAQRGLHATVAYAPHVLLLDIGMPVMDGYRMAESVRHRNGFQPTLIAISGFADEENKKRAAAAGFNHFFAKPADLDELRILLDAIKVSRQGATDER